jgi:class 3 adenylate cyclase
MSFPPLNIPSLQHLLPRFSDLLRDHRTVRGLTIEAVAAKAGIAPSALREMEAGTRPAPSRKIVRAIADAMSLDGEDRRTLVDAAELTSPAVRMALGYDTPATQPEQPAAQPAAIFAFLIADIRGYTSFTERLGDEAAARLATRFAEMARAAMEQWDGRLVELRGDEALGAFASARQAVRAAGDLQARYLAEASAHPELPPGIGIGLDIGEAVPVENGYRGVALNRAARLCSLAGPGETLVSPGVFYVAPHVEGVRFIPRGQEQLKGFPDPVAILQAAPAEIVDADATPQDEQDDA